MLFNISRLRRKLSVACKYGSFWLFAVIYPCGGFLSAVTFLVFQIKGSNALWTCSKLLLVYDNDNLIYGQVFSWFGVFLLFLKENRSWPQAIGSTVILTTVTDVVGFFSFLGLASLILFIKDLLRLYGLFDTIFCIVCLGSLFYVLYWSLHYYLHRCLIYLY